MDESLEQVLARHRKELKELQGRVTNKKKNATKKTRKGVNEECAHMEAEVKAKHAVEVAALNGDNPSEEPAPEQDEELPQDERINGTGATEEGRDSLESATADLSLSSKAEAPSQPGQGKKRNRQKERLARRAAEQEAAAERAEEEASHMTDNRARESEYMKKMFKTYKLAEKDIEPDGHCLFSAVADQLEQNGIPLAAGEEKIEKGQGYKVVRRAAAGYMREHADDFAPFLEEGLESYTEKIESTAEWGGQLELMALARRYGVEIRVVQDGRMEKIGEEEGKESGKCLWLAYYRHGYGLGEHYNSLRRR